VNGESELIRIVRRMARKKRNEWSGMLRKGVGKLINIVDNNTCRHCGFTPAMCRSYTYRDLHYGWMYAPSLEVDHILPISRGGDNNRSNLQTLCSRCNSSKGTRLPEEWKHGRMMKRHLKRMEFLKGQEGHVISES